MTANTDNGDGIAIAVQGLAVHYRDVRALDDVSFALAARGVTGLLGPNGAGKSTLLRVIATVQKPDAGILQVLGEAVYRHADMTDARAKLGYMPQDPGFYPRFRVQQFATHIALLKRISGRAARRQEVARVLDLVDLTDKARSPIRTLSGGMQRRLALACALIGDPPILVLDKPTVGLDPEQRIRFREIIADLGARHCVLLSTHQTDDIAELCHNVLVLVDGEVRFTGTTNSLRSQAEGRVWLAAKPTDGAVAGWATATGAWRGVGQPPDGVELLDPSVDDGYLIVANDPSVPNRSDRR